MGLVHRYQGDGSALGEGEKIGGIQPLRSHVNDLVLALGCPFQGPGLLGGGEGTIDISRRRPSRPQRRHLIAHQGNQGRNHKGHPLLHQRRHLVADGLARPGGHYPQDVLTVQQRVHQRLLALAKPYVAEVFPQHPLLIHPASPYWPGPLRTPLPYSIPAPTRPVNQEAAYSFHY